MSADLIVHAMLAANAAVGTQIGTRFYAEARPEQDPLPGLVTTLISDAPRPPFSQAGAEPCTGRVQIESHAASVAASKAAIEAAAAACHKQSGSYAGFQVTASLQENCRSGGYDALHGVYSHIVDIIVHYVR